MNNQRGGARGGGRGGWRGVGRGDGGVVGTGQGGRGLQQQGMTSHDGGSVYPCPCLNLNQSLNIQRTTKNYFFNAIASSVAMPRDLLLDNRAV